MLTNCSKCGLYQYSEIPYCIGRGNSINPLLVLIGEAPGPDEAKVGRPFVGKAGKKLDNMISSANKDHIYITNMVKCFPPQSTKDPSKGFRTPNELEVGYCKPNLLQELDKLTSEYVIMTLGSVALFGLIGPHNGITKELGLIRKIKINGKERYLVPNYHPSYIMRNSKKNEVEFRRVFEETYTDIIKE